MTNQQPAVSTLFDLRSGENFIVRVGTTTGTSTTGVLNQVASVTATEQIDRPSDTHRRLGSSTATVRYRQPALKSGLQLTFFSSVDAADLYAASNNSLSIDGTESLTIQVEQFEDDGTLSGLWRLSGLRIVNRQPISISADAPAAQNSITYESLSAWTLYQP